MVVRLVKIEHSRCGESAGTTFMWAPTAKTEAQFHNDCLEAQDALLTAEQAWNAQKKNSQRFPLYMDRPDVSFLAEHLDNSVGEMLDAWDSLKAEAKAFAAAIDAARRGFADHMHDRGYLYLSERDPPLTELLNWGHNHGVKIALDANDNAEPASADLLGQDANYPRYREI